MAYNPAAFTNTTGAQVRAAYDATHYTDFTTGSGGNLTIAPTGGSTSITGALAVSSTFAAAQTTIAVADSNAQLKLQRTGGSAGYVWIGADDTKFYVLDSGFATRFSVEHATGNAVAGGTLATNGVALKSGSYGFSTGPYANILGPSEALLDIGDTVSPVLKYARLMYTVATGLLDIFSTADGGVTWTDIHFNDTQLRITGATGAVSIPGAVSLATANTTHTVTIGGGLGSDSSSYLKFLGSNAAINWQFAANYAAGGDFAIMYSTAGGGSTFATAALYFTSAGAATFSESIVVGSPTGGAKGTGTINAVAVYDDNVLLTDWLFDLAYDGKTAHKVPAGGRLWSLAETMFVAQDERRLPWMPTRESFEDDRNLGGMVSRLWQGQEQQQLYIHDLAGGDAQVRSALRTIIELNPILAGREIALAALEA